MIPSWLSEVLPPCHNPEPQGRDDKTGKEKEKKRDETASGQNPNTGKTSKK
jgi:hypothetical protein